jgi:deoxyhypusine synthase
MVSLVYDLSERPVFTYGEVKPIEVKERNIHELLLEMSNTSFQARALGEAYRVLLEMLQDPDNTVFLGLAGSMSTAGMWKIIKWLVEERYVDVVVSTGAIISEDIYEAMGFKYYKVDPCVDDEMLLKHKYDRFYDTVASELDYRKMEALIKEFVETLPDNKTYSTPEFLYEFGEYLDERNIDSIVSAAYRAKVPVFSPALVDSGYGMALLQAYRRGKRIVLDMVKDFYQLVEIGRQSRKLSAIYIGGGVPKDYVNLMTVAQTLIAEYEEGLHDYYKGFEYIVQFTTDLPQWGGLSGATLEEAVSWGKVSPHARKRTVHVDATIALPIVAHGLITGRIKRVNPKNTIQVILQ